MNIIFVCGIHGSGKTTLCSYLSDKLNIPFFTASELIKGKNSTQLPTYPNKVVSNIDMNQEILLNSLIDISQYQCIILDGHVTLFDKDNGISKIPISFFKLLNIITIILLNTSAYNIIKRLKARDNMLYSEEFVKKTFIHRKGIFERNC